MDNQWESCRLHRDHLPSPFLPGKGAVCQCGEGTGWDHAWAARTWTLKLEEGLFYYIIKVFGSNVRLNCIDGTFVFIHLAILASKEELAVHFPSIDTLKKKKKKRKRLYSGNLLLGYCQSKYLASSVLIKRQQLEVSSSPGTILRAVGIGARKEEPCSPSSGGVLILNCSFVPVRSKPTYRLP